MEKQNGWEATELQKLLRAASTALNELADREEIAGLDVEANFTITINDQTCTFVLGAPQVEGLYAFINHIADENWHIVDFENKTVTGTL